MPSFKFFGHEEGSKMAANNSSSCFELIDSENAAKTATITFSVLTSLVLPPICYSVVWFEKFGTDSKRTLINMLVSSICWNGIVWCFTVQNLYSLRFAIGPLPTYVCFWFMMLKKMFVAQGLMLINAMTIVRYVFILWLKNPAAFKDDFWFMYINVWIVSFSFISQLVRAMAPGNHQLEYKLCTGHDPNYILTLPPVGRGLVESISVIIHICVYIRIAVHRLKSVPAGPEARSLFLKNLVIMDMEKDSLSSFAINFVSSVLIAASVIVAIMINLKTCEDFGTYPKFLLTYFNYLVLPNLAMLGTMFLYYLRSERLRKTMFRKFRESLRRCRRVS